MLDKPLDQIAFEDLTALLREQWPEGKGVDYKGSMYGNSDAEKKELLKDVSSFANTIGGDLIVGIEEEHGVPISIPGVKVENVEGERLRLEEIIRRGIEPRIDFAIRPVPNDAGATVFIIRVRESWIFPHRVVYQGKSGEFWARNSSGKYSMDTIELRRAFTLSETVFDKIKTFRRERVAAITAGNSLIGLGEGGKLILHLIPIAAYRSHLTVDVQQRHDLCQQLPPLRFSGWDFRLNLDGFVTFRGAGFADPGRAYTQLFSNGIIEAVTDEIKNHDREGREFLDASGHEQILLEKVPLYLDCLRGLGVDAPIWCLATFTGVKGALIGNPQSCPGYSHPVDRDTLHLPEAILEDMAGDVRGILRPLFEVLWNAGGLVRPRGQDEQGR